MSPRLQITVFRNSAQDTPARLPLTLWARIRLLCSAVAVLALVVVIFVAALIVGSVIAATVLAVLVVLVAFAILRTRFRSHTD